MADPARWRLSPVDRDAARRLASALDISLPAARVLCARGYGEPEAARRFFAPSLDDLYDPRLLAGMDAALDRLQRAIRAGEKILLYGDYDVDGTTSVAILKKAIELAGGAATFHIPHRLHDGYGMHSGAIDEAASAGVSLIISLDTGIRAAGAVCHARKLGIDVIVTDHHLPEAELPPAIAILNPNQPGCPYPEKNLCGAGVAFKLVQALLGTLGWPAGKLRRVTESFLKIVAIATVADVVPLTGENRVIVKHGLEALCSVRNPGLRTLMHLAGIADGATPTAAQVAFRIAPRLNAAGRMANANAAVELLLTADEERARALAEELHSLNRDRQDTEAEIVRLALEECMRAPVDGQSALVFSGRGWHRGVVGIVASRLVERFHRPVFVLGHDVEQGIVQGSGRSIPGFHLLEALESMPELFLRFGGHRQAAGVALVPENVEVFRERLNAYAAARLTPDDFVPEIEIDSELEFNEIDDRSVRDLLKLAPFGYGNPAPVLWAPGLEVASPPVVWKEKHARITLRGGNRTLAVKAWNFAPRVQEFPRGAIVDAAFCFEPDDYMGQSGWCAVLRDLRPKNR
jgi:single-stranded-DNA-specific exonuclease